MGRGCGRTILLSMLAAGMCVVLLPAAAESAAPIPDFSGIWGRNSVDYEPPPSGPGPVMNKTRTFYMRIGDDTNPILRPEAAEKVRQAAAVSRTGVNFPTPSNGCTPWPPLYGWRSLLMQMVQGKDEVVIIHVGDQQMRHIRLNQQHPRNVRPSYSGDSVGHYEGDTLVIDTVGIKTRPGSMVDLYGTPHSPALHVVERYRLVDAATAAAAQERSEKEYGRPTTEPVYVDFNNNGKGLEVKFTVEDPGVFTTSWSSSVTYRRSNSDWLEIVCAENLENYYPNATTTVPRADPPDF